MHRGDVVMYVMCLSRRDASAEDGRKWYKWGENGCVEWGKKQMKQGMEGGVQIRSGTADDVGLAVLRMTHSTIINISRSITDIWRNERGVEKRKWGEEYDVG